MPRTKTEMCPFCGDKFATGLDRGAHILVRHKAEMDELIAQVADSRVEAGRVR